MVGPERYVGFSTAEKAFRGKRGKRGERDGEKLLYLGVFTAIALIDVRPLIVCYRCRYRGNGLDQPLFQKKRLIVEGGVGGGGVLPTHHDNACHNREQVNGPLEVRWNRDSSTKTRI